MASKKRKQKRKPLNLKIRPRRKGKHRVTVVPGTGDKDYKFPDLPKSIRPRLDVDNETKRDETNPLTTPEKPTE